MQQSFSLLQMTSAETHTTMKASHTEASPGKQSDKHTVHTEVEARDDNLPCILLKPARLVRTRAEDEKDSDLGKNEMSDDDLPCIQLSSVHGKQKGTTTPLEKQASAVGPTKSLVLEDPLTDHKVPAK
jgi:hypothetical protein